MGYRALSYRDLALHFDALRLVALRGGDRVEEILATENGRELLLRVQGESAVEIVKQS